MATRSSPDRSNVLPLPEAGRPSGALTLWAALGLVSVALAATTYGRWIGSPQFTPVRPGPDHYPYLWVLRSRRRPPDWIR